MRNKSDTTVKSNFENIVKGFQEKQAEHDANVTRLSERYAIAKDTLLKAKDALDEAQKAYDPEAMVEAKAKVNASQEVADLFRDALDKEKRSSLYSATEVDQIRREADSYIQEVNESASYALGEILAKMIPIVEESEKTFNSVNAFLLKLGEGTTHRAPAIPNGLLDRLIREVHHDRQHFAKYLPEK